MRQVRGIYSSPAPHWVGDGFPVRSMLSHAVQGEHVSPFLHLDHAGPAHFPPAEQPRGVGVHPHRGFETVTIVYQGEVEHRDFYRCRWRDRSGRRAVDDGGIRHPA